MRTDRRMERQAWWRQWVFIKYPGNIHCSGKVRQLSWPWDFRLKRRCKWDLRSPEVLRSVEWQYLTDVLGQPIATSSRVPIDCFESSARNSRKAWNPKWAQISFMTDFDKRVRITVLVSSQYSTSVEFFFDLSSFENRNRDYKSTSKNRVMWVLIPAAYVKIKCMISP